jgi:uncharacterized delta-60 repeat protein
MLRTPNPLCLGSLSLSWLLVNLALAAAAAPPVINYPPRSQTVMLYQRAGIGVIASGTAPIAYQWRKDGVPVAGATNDQIIFTHSQFCDGGIYSVIVSNSEGALISTDASLTINVPRAGDLDYSFASETVTDGAIRSIAVQTDGKILIAGDFTRVHGVARGFVARLNADSTTDFTFLNGLAGANAAVRALAVQIDGKILIGGRFTTVNGVERNGIARLNPDGSLDASFQNGMAGALGGTQGILALALQPGGKLFMSGDFTSVNNFSRKAVARLNSDGSLDFTLQNPISGTFGAPQAIASLVVQPDGKILMAATYVTISGISRHGIARMNFDGSLDAAFAGGLAETDYDVDSLAVQSDRKVLIGGYFTVINGVSRNKIARLNSDGSLDTSFQSGMSGVAGGQTVWAVSPQPDSKVLLAGDFTAINGVNRNRMARLNADGSLDAGFQNGLSGADGSVFALALQPNGKMFVAGYFQVINDVSRDRIAWLNADGTVDPNFHNPVVGPNGEIYSFALQSDGNLLIGGNFNAVNGASRGRISRLHADGTLDNAFQNGLPGVNGNVNSIVVQNDGDVLIGGSFSSVNDTGRSGVARLKNDGSLDNGFLSRLAGPNGVVGVIAAQPDAKVLVGGSFSTFNRINRNNIVRLNPDGSVDAGFQNGLTGANGTVYLIAGQADGKVLIGGNFSQINGTARSGLARLNEDGTLDTSFQTGPPGAVSAVNAIALQNDGKLIIGGGFTSVQGVARNGIARLNADGTLDRSFLDGLPGVGGGVNSVVVQDDGKVLIGGYFSLVHGASRRGIARLNADGTLDNSFVGWLSGAAGLSSANVRLMKVQSDGRILIQGSFAGINGVVVSGLLRLWGSPPGPTIPLGLTCPPDIHVQCDSDVPPSNPATVSIADKCDSTLVVFHVNDVTNDVSPKTIWRTYRGTNASGLLFECTQTITIQDTTPPRMLLPSDIIVSCDSDIPAPAPDDVFVTDNCDPAPRVIHVADVTNGLCHKAVFRAYRATDASGNSTTWIQTIFVENPNPVVFICTPPCAIHRSVSSAAPWEFVTPTAIAACDGTNLSVSIVSTMTNDCTITRTWRAQDPCGASATFAQSVTVVAENSRGAMTNHVSNLQDSGPGSLRQAVADSQSGDWIKFRTVGTIRLTNGEIGITNSIAILGPGAVQLAVSARNASRIFRFCAGVTCSVSGLTIRDGRAPDGATNSLTGGNGADGGGIYNAGTLTLSGCILTANRAGNGGAGASSIDNSSPGSAGGSGGSGGALYNVGTLKLMDCIVSNNFAGAGGVGGMGVFPRPGGSGGSGGSGGGICNVGTLTIAGGMLSGNGSGSGGNAGDGGVGVGGAGGDGGGIWNEQGVATITACTVHTNSCGYGGQGSYGALSMSSGGNGGAGGSGAGLGNRRGDVTLTFCSVSGNTSGAGNYGGFALLGGWGGVGGSGAGIWNDSGSMAVVACTVSGNLCGSGGSGNGENGAPGGKGGDGAGIGNQGGILTMTASTVTGNSCGSGGRYAYFFEGPANQFRTASGGSGGGVAALSGDMGFTILQNSLIAQNSSGHSLCCGSVIITNSAPGPDLAGDFTSRGHNLIGAGNGSSGFIQASNGDLVGTTNAPINPRLGPLQDNGGPTFTHALLADSPAIDAGTNSGLDFDQRAQPRTIENPAIPNAPGGDGTDIGALEVNPILTGVEVRAIGQDVLVRFTSVSDKSYGVQFKSELEGAVWTELPGAVIGTGGLATYTDLGAAVLPRRFYRLFERPP